MVTGEARARRSFGEGDVARKSGDPLLAATMMKGVAKLAPPLRVWVRTILSPRWGCLTSQFTHGLRRGLYSCAAPRLWIAVAGKRYCEIRVLPRISWGSVRRATRLLAVPHVRQFPLPAL